MANEGQLKSSLGELKNRASNGDFQLAPPDLVFDDFELEDTERELPATETRLESNPAAGSIAEAIPGPSNGRLPVMKPGQATKSLAAPSAQPQVGRMQIDACPDDTTVMQEVIRGAKTWGVSFFVHFVVIVVLGLLTFRVVQPESMLFTAKAEKMDEMEVMELPTSFEMTSTDALESQPSQVEMPSLNDMEMAESLALEFEESDFGDRIAGVESMFGTIAKSGSLSDQEGNGLGTSFYGIQATGQSFVFVVDRSGSMVGEPWLQARAELLRSITQLSEQQEFFVVLFNHEDEPMHGLRGRRAKLQDANQANVDRARRWIGDQIPTGGTMPKDAIKQALRLKPDVIFLLSDGVFRDGTLEYLREENAKKRRSMGEKRTVVHTIAFRDFVGANLLQQIAVENGGKFKFVQ